MVFSQHLTHNQDTGAQRYGNLCALLLLVKHFVWKIKFSIGKHEKEIEKISVSAADAFWKVEMDYRRASKPPVLISATPFDLP